MPLLNGRLVKFIPHPTDIPPTANVFRIRFTGEIFKEYEEYSARLDFYRQPKFSCKYTGKSGFNYENALDNENKTKQQIYALIPSQYIPIILSHTQFSQLKLTDLVNTIATKLISDLQPQNSAQNILKTANNNTQTPNTTNSKPKTPKCPIKKTLIRTFIRVIASQFPFKLAPWIVQTDIAIKYDIPTQIPPNLQELITQYTNKQKAKNMPKIKKKKVKKPKKPKSKSLSIAKAKSVKPETLISALTIQTTKSLKYPCDDQLLLMYDKHENNRIIAFDTFWNKIGRIGLSSHGLINDAENEDNYSNLAFIDYNQMYDDENENIILKHRQLNDVFNEVWNIWSFCTVYHTQLSITPFPISYLMDGLCYDKRCIVLDEIHCVLLEIIRKHIIDTIEERIEQEREHKMKRKIARKKAQRSNKRAAERKRLKRLEQQRQKECEAKKSDKQEMDESEEESESDEETESESESESESETESDESEIEITESSGDEMDANAIINAREDYNALIFSTEVIQSFRLDLLRDYLQFRCKDKSGDDSESETKMDIDGEEESVMVCVSESLSAENEPLLPECDYVLSDAIWDKMNNIRNYVSLGIEHKLEILSILFKDAMSTCVMREMTTDRVNKYQELKGNIKALDEEYSRMVKSEKNKLKVLRNELIEKKRILYPKKRSKSKAKSTKKNAKNDSKSVTTAQSTASASNSVSASNSPNKENKASKANSKSGSLSVSNIPNLNGRTRRQNELFRQKQEKEQKAMVVREEQKKEDLQSEVFRLDNLLKRNRGLMDEKCRIKELETKYQKYKLQMEYRTHLTELGSDRFYNKYFWSLFSDGRIFVLHSNSMYHLHESESITKEMIRKSVNGMKCYNEWECYTESEGNRSCWSYISTTTEFSELLSVLDVRGLRENELLTNLNALKNDIVRMMKMVGNDDFQKDMSADISMNEASVESEEKPKQLRRSTRAKKTSIVNKSSECNHIQFGNKGFLAYRNKIKRN